MLHNTYDQVFWIPSGQLHWKEYNPELYAVLADAKATGNWRLVIWKEL